MQAIDPVNSALKAGGKKAVGSLIDAPAGAGPAAPTPPSPPAKAPDLATASDRARIMREQEDAARKKRGRAASIFTGNEGVGASPVGLKTLVGS